ncbi:unnamed protein product [Cochlearia groenlandica]
MTTKEVWKLINRKVMVHFDEETGQPDEDSDSAGLFASYLGQLSGDVSLLPIDYTDWRNYPDHRKETAWKLIQSKFWFENPEKRKKYVISVLGSRCKDLKVRIWKTYKRYNKQETLNNRPKVIPDDQWKNFVEERFSEKWKAQLEDLMSQQPTWLTEKNNAASLDDDFAIVFGPERSGRIRCLGRGPTPSTMLNRVAPQIQLQDSEK